MKAYCIILVLDWLQKISPFILWNKSDYNHGYINGTNNHCGSVISVISVSGPLMFCVSVSGVPIANKSGAV